MSFGSSTASRSFSVSERFEALAGMTFPSTLKTGRYTAERREEPRDGTGKLYATIIYSPSDSDFSADELKATPDEPVGGSTPDTAEWVATRARFNRCHYESNFVIDRGNDVFLRVMSCSILRAAGRTVGALTPRFRANLAFGSSFVG